jgi:hypothetical protein
VVTGGARPHSHVSKSVNVLAQESLEGEERERKKEERKKKKKMICPKCNEWRPRKYWSDLQWSSSVMTPGSWENPGPPSGCKLCRVVGGVAASPDWFGEQQQQQQQQQQQPCQVMVAQQHSPDHVHYT